MHNQEQLEAARDEFNRIWDRSIRQQFPIELPFPAKVYDTCWQCFLHGLRWVAVPESKDDKSNVQ